MLDTDEQNKRDAVAGAGSVTIRHYVEYLYPGSLFSEEESIQIDTPQDINAALKSLKPGAFAFKFYSLRIRKATVVGKQIKDAERFDESGMFYPNGKTYTAPEVQALGPDYRTLLSNMECNDYPKVVKTRRGNWQPFYAKDFLIDPAAPTASTDPPSERPANPKGDL